MHMWPTKCPPGSVVQLVFIHISLLSSSQLLLSMLFFKFCVLFVHHSCFYCQTSLPMFRSKAFTVRRRYSDFLGLYEKLSVKQSLQGCIIPPPPEKSVVGGCPSLYLVFYVYICVFCFFFFFHFCYLDQQE